MIIEYRGKKMTLPISWCKIFANRKKHTLTLQICLENLQIFSSIVLKTNVCI